MSFACGLDAKDKVKLKQANEHEFGTLTCAPLILIEGHTHTNPPPDTTCRKGLKL
jgi:hypothetical protein